MGVFSDMKAHAPSRRVTSVAIIFAAVIAGVAIYQQASNTPLTSNPFVTNQLRENENELDTDGDGLKDWEEALWGFSPVNTDTDGDGIGDYQEAENERRIVAETPAEILAQYQTNTSLQPSSTALAGQIVLSQLFAAKQAGVSVPGNSLELASEIALKDTSGTRTYTTYTTDTVSITDGSNAVALRAYGNTLGAALNDPTGTAPHELFVLLSYVQTNDAETFKQQMDLVLANYDRVIAGFIATPTPSTLATLHVSLINALVRVRTDLADIRNIEQGPINATIALDAYDKNSTTMAQLFQQLRTVFEGEGIVFGEAEAGYRLMQTQ